MAVAWRRQTTICNGWPPRRTAESPARYELASARDLALAVPSGTILAGNLTPNPDFVNTSTDQNSTRYLLWGVLVVAVLVLGTLTLRLAKRESVNAT